MPYPFPKQFRLCLSQDFRLLRKESKQKAGLCIIVNQRMTTKVCRLGITASKKFGKAHHRNRFKRIVREAFRLTLDQLPQGLEIEVIPRKTALSASMEDIRKDLLTLCVPQVVSEPQVAEAVL